MTVLHTGHVQVRSNGSRNIALHGLMDESGRSGCLQANDSDNILQNAACNFCGSTA